MAETKATFKNLSALKAIAIRCFKRSRLTNMGNHTDHQHQMYSQAQKSN